MSYDYSITTTKRFTIPSIHTFTIQLLMNQSGVKLELQ